MTMDPEYDPDDLAFGFSVVDEAWFNDPEADWDYALDPDDPDNPFPT